jgi:hypothetical protein
MHERPPSSAAQAAAGLAIPGALHATQVEFKQMGVLVGVRIAEQSVLRKQRAQLPVTVLQNGVAALRSLQPVFGSAPHATQLLVMGLQ